MTILINQENKMKDTEIQVLGIKVKQRIIDKYSCEYISESYEKNFRKK